jgi:argininosuccinate lyase
VQRAEAEGTSLAEVSLDTLRQEHPAFGPEVSEVFDWERSVDSRDTDGGTSRRAVLAQLEAARHRLREPTPSGKGD